MSFLSSLVGAAAGGPPAEPCARCGAALGPDAHEAAYGWVRCAACHTLYDRPPLPPPFAAVPRPGDRCEPLTYTLAEHGGTRVLVPRRQTAGAVVVAAAAVLLLPLGCGAAVFGWGLVSAAREGRWVLALPFAVVVGGMLALSVAHGIRAFRARRRVRLAPGVVTVERIPGLGTSPAPSGPPEQTLRAADVRALRAAEYWVTPNRSIRNRRYRVFATGPDGAESAVVGNFTSGWDALFVAQEAGRALGLDRTPWGWGR